MTQSKLELALKKWQDLLYEAIKSGAHWKKQSDELLEALEQIESFIHELAEEQKRLYDKPMSYSQATILNICQNAIKKARGKHNE